MPTSRTRKVQQREIHTYLAQTLAVQLKAAQQDLIEIEQVRIRTHADIKHIRRQIAALRRRARNS